MMALEKAHRKSRKRILEIFWFPLGFFFFFSIKTKKEEKEKLTLS
jgi:hypothetical protein